MDLRVVLAEVQSWPHEDPPRRPLGGRRGQGAGEVQGGNLPVVLSEPTETEVDAAWSEGQAGLGAKFTVQVREVLTPIGRTPELYAMLHENTRRAGVGKFPYNVLYRVQIDRVEVIAVLHGRRDPSAWKGRD